jgi:prefoldin subunit 5
MSDTTDIEKKSLEAHVELCAERYRLLETKIEAIDDKIVVLHTAISELRSMISTMSTKRNEQIINWGIGIIAALCAAVGYLVTNFLTK